MDSPLELAHAEDQTSQASQSAEAAEAARETPQSREE
jgi:hypothetical protein